MLTATSDVADVSVICDDASEKLIDAAASSLVVSVDIETTGLDWANDTIATVQLAVPNGPAEVIRIRDQHQRPVRLTGLLESTQILKIFHHAMFDLRFINRTWEVSAQRVACTKVASKIADPQGDVGHSLANLVDHYLGIVLEKDEQTSDWQRPELSPSQIAYAINDVSHLSSLLYAVLSDLRQQGLEDLALRCFEHVPVRVKLEVEGYGDVFTY